MIAFTGNIVKDFDSIVLAQLFFYFFCGLQSQAVQVERAVVRVHAWQLSGVGLSRNELAHYAGRDQVATFLDWTREDTKTMDMKESFSRIEPSTTSVNWVATVDEDFS